MIKSSATKISDNYKLRSQFVWYLINDQKNFASRCAGQNIPLVLFNFGTSANQYLVGQQYIEYWRPLEE